MSLLISYVLLIILAVIVIVGLTLFSETIKRAHDYTAPVQDFYDNITLDEEIAGFYSDWINYRDDLKAERERNRTYRHVKKCVAQGEMPTSSVSFNYLYEMGIRIDGRKVYKFYHTQDEPEPTWAGMVNVEAVELAFELFKAENPIATAEDVKKTRHKAAKMHHPDHKNPRDKEFNTQVLARINNWLDSYAQR